MFEQRTKRPIIVSDDNLQCNCFGTPQQGQQLFLSKHKSLQIKDKHSVPKLVYLSEQEIPFKNSNKRSLRNNNSPNHNTLTSRSKNDEYYKCIQTPPVKKQLRTLDRINPFLKGSEEKVYHIEQRRSPQVSNFTNVSHVPPLWKPLAHQNCYYVPPIPIATPRFIITHNQPVRIHHSPPPTHYSPQLSPRTPVKIDANIAPKKLSSLNQIKQEVVIRIKSQNKEEISINRQSQSRCNQEEIIEFQLTEDNIDSPRLMPVQKKPQYALNMNYSLKNQDRNKLNLHQYSFGDTFKSIIKPKSKTKAQKDPFKSKIQCNKVGPTWKSLTDDPSGQRLGLKQKKSLRKMDDVDEIHSLGGSEKSSDDKESVVLGRLQQYGSMLDPTLSLSNPTIGSKLVSMNTQSSVGKSFVKSFDYFGERNQFKWQNM